jgi:phosphatidylethanolamine/phosphatidyl-N-methylethanolamine N-methyltransferase
VLERLANAGNHGCRLTAFEINPRMAENLRQAQPRADVRNADALTVVDVVDREKLPPVDLVVSGLGWPSLPAGVRDGLLDATREILSPGGEFRTFGYHVGLLFPGAWAFRARCRTLFGSFERGPVIWRNLPPAFVYRCVKPALSKRR